MRPIDWIKNLYTKVPATIWLWVGCGAIGLSIALQAIAYYYPPVAFAFNTLGYILAFFSVPLTILQAYKSARDQAKKDFYNWSRNREGEQYSNLYKSPTSMQDSQEQHR
jgi:hypothetical protein